MKPSEEELYLFRALCGGCGAVLWTDQAIHTRCLCGQSEIAADGTLIGECKPVNDGQMQAFIAKDRGLDNVTLRKKA